MFKKSHCSLLGDVRSKATDDPSVRLCSNRNSSSSESPVRLCPSPALSPRSEEVINIAKLAAILFRVLFFKQALRCPFPRAVTQEVHCRCGIHTIYLSFSHCMSPCRTSQEEAMKPHEKTLDRGLLLARKRLSSCRSIRLHSIKRLSGVTSC